MFTGSRRCSHKKQDLFVVVDGSKDVGSKEFHKVKKFLQDFVTRLDVGLGKTHVGLLVVNNRERTKIEISLGQYDTSVALSHAIGRIKRRRRNKADMAYALDLVQRKVRVSLLFYCSEWTLKEHLKFSKIAKFGCKIL